MKTAAIFLLLFFPSLLFSQTDIDFFPDSLFVQSSPGVPYEIGIDAIMVTPPGFSFDGFQNAILMPAPTQTTLNGFTLGAAVLALNGGAGPDFAQVDTVDFGGLTDNLMTFGCIVSLAGTDTLPLTGTYRLADFEFESAAIGASFFTIAPVFASNPPTGNYAVFRNAQFGQTFTIPAVPSNILVFQEISIAEFVRGDVNQDRAVNISDPIFMLDVLFGPTFPTPACADAADANDDGSLNLADPITVLFWLFSGGPPPPAPFPSCGIDSTADGFDCGSVPVGYC